jgi:hypothetical protein
MSLRSCGLRQKSSMRRLSETCSILAGISCPIVWQQALSDVPMKRRIGPIAHTLCQSMFDWIEVNVIDMPRKVAVIADRVLPKSPLPKREIAIWPALHIKASLNQCVAEMPLDPPPPARKICVIRWQREDGAQMIRENHDSVDRKWPCAASRAECRTQRAYVVHKSVRTPVSEGDRKEVSPARNKVASISDHFQQSTPPDGILILIGPESVARMSEAISGADL